MNKLPQHFAVFGSPIQHSLSPLIHQRFAQQTQRAITYEKIEVNIENFATAVAQFQLQGGDGLNITAPLKQSAYQLCNETATAASQAKAVNTVTFQTGKIIGHNTDGVGLVRDVMINYQQPICNKRILLLGAGGAARGICGPLLAENPSQLHIANRTLTNARELSLEFNRQDIITFSDLGNFPRDAFDLIINSCDRTTVFEEFPTHIIGNRTFCYDLNYATASSFLLWAKKNAAIYCSDGLGMLVEQAAAAFKIWHGVFPETRAVLDELRETQQYKS